MSWKELSDALDLLSDVRSHIKLMEMATRYNPGDDDKAFAAVIHTTLGKLENAMTQLEHLWGPQP